jgi:hypothetical protein
MLLVPRLMVRSSFEESISVQDLSIEIAVKGTLGDRLLPGGSWSA